MSRPERVFKPRQEVWITKDWRTFGVRRAEVLRTTKPFSWRKPSIEVIFDDGSIEGFDQEWIYLTKRRASVFVIKACDFKIESLKNDLLEAQTVCKENPVEIASLQSLLQLTESASR